MQTQSNINGLGWTVTIEQGPIGGVLQYFLGWKEGIVYNNYVLTDLTDVKFQGQISSSPLSSWHFVTGSPVLPFDVASRLNGERAEEVVANGEDLQKHKQ